MEKQIQVCRFSVICTQTYVEDGTEYWSEGNIYTAETDDFENFRLTSNLSDNFESAVGKDYLLDETEAFFAIDENTRMRLTEELSSEHYSHLSGCFSHAFIKN